MTFKRLFIILAENVGLLMIIRETTTVDTTDKLKVHTQSSEGSSRSGDTIFWRTDWSAVISNFKAYRHRHGNAGETESRQETEIYHKNGNRNPKTRQPQESKTSDAPDQTLRY